MGWQDPSTDIENVNAAYRIERERNERLRRALAALFRECLADDEHFYTPAMHAAKEALESA